MDITFSKRPSLAKTALWGLLCRIAGLVIGLGTSVFLARTLGPDRFGQYAFLVTIAEMLTIVALFGTPALITREVASGLTTKVFSKIRGLLSWASRLTGSLSLVLAGLVFFFLYFYRQNSLQGVSGLTLLFAVALILIAPLTRQAGCTLQGLGKVVLAQALTIIVSPGLFLFFIVYFYLTPTGISLSAVFALLLFSRLIALWFAEYKKYQYLPHAVRTSKPVYHSRLWLKSALPLLAVGSMLIINTRIDIIMLGFLGDAADVGIYKVAQKGGQIMLFGVMAVDAMLSLIAAKAWANGEIN